MAHKDILGREINKGSFVVYTSPATGLRIGLVIDANADGWTGSYTYVHKKVRVIALSHTDNHVVAQSATTPEITKVLVIEDIPQEYKDILLERAREAKYV